MTDEFVKNLNTIQITTQANIWISKDVDEYLIETLPKYTNRFIRIFLISTNWMFMRALSGMSFDRYVFFEDGGGIEVKVRKFRKFMESKKFYLEHYIEKVQRVEKEYEIKKKGGTGYKRTESKKSYVEVEREVAEQFNKQKLKSLNDHNMQKIERVRLDNEYPRRTGVACPDCGSELWVESGMVNLSCPPTAWAGCENKKCGGRHLV